MTVAEKIGQLVQSDASYGYPPDYLGDAIRAGQLGAVLNTSNVAHVNELQRIAMEESRLSIPLLVGRDVIHGFATVAPIPLGQAATWNPHLVQAGARAAALEACCTGINWTFAPMIDITRDPRWGRIAESFGEDPLLASRLGVAMVRGFQTDDPMQPTAIAACAKHFAAYGATEGGRDYSATQVPENELRNVHLRPFQAAVDAGVLSLMTSFSDVDGVPATANAFLLRSILREEWQFAGLVVSDWQSVQQLQTHGLTASDAESAAEAITAGVDIEMAGTCYQTHLAELLTAGAIDPQRLDAAVANVLRVKCRLGLFDSARYRITDRTRGDVTAGDETAKALAQQSCVLLKHTAGVLPLSATAINTLGVLGPLADAPYQQLGTWIFDGDVERSVTPLESLRELAAGQFEVKYERALMHSRSKDTSQFEQALAVAQQSDAVLLFLGEESILSGEAHSRANIDLPGAQVELVAAVRAIGKPVVAVILAGRPLTLANVLEHVDAVLFCWHPGTFAGPAITELLFGAAVPSGKLPVTFPRVVGQIPIFYNHKNTGRPPSADTVAHIDSLDSRAPQTSLGMSAYYLDAGFEPQFPFGFGLSYATLRYHDLRLSQSELMPGDELQVSVRITNDSEYDCEEVAQLYIRDVAANVTRPVRELKDFSRVRVPAGQTVDVSLALHTDDLGFFGRHNRWMVEAGAFELWVGADSNATLGDRFTLQVPPDASTLSTDR
ncbi:MAG: glycoside hydrolase family 3 N-terminal domain-containing protein [Pseudomonadota bacterium]